MDNDAMNGTRDSGMDGSGSMMESARQQVQPMLQQTQAKAGEWLGQARDKAVDQLDTQMDHAAGGMSSMAQALRQAGQQMRGQEQAMFAPYLEGAADYVDQFSGYLQEQDVRRMMDEVTGFARRQPGWFLGGAFVLGFLAARFLKSSSPNVTQNETYPTVDYAGARGQREFASSGPFTGPAHDRAAMGPGTTRTTTADYAAASARGMADTTASGMAGIGATAPGGIGTRASAVPGSAAGSVTATPGGTPVADLDTDEEEYSSTAGSSAAGRSSDDR